MINNVVLVGRLTNDVELRHTPSGISYARFILAVDRNLSKEKREEFVQKQMPTADFIRIGVWGKQGENCANYIGKGRLVAVSGRIQTGSYMGQDGTRKYTTEVVADTVRFLDRGNDSLNNNQFSSNDYYNQENSNSYPEDDFYKSDMSDQQVPF